MVKIIGNSMTVFHKQSRNMVYKSDLNYNTEGIMFI